MKAVRFLAPRQLRLERISRPEKPTGSRVRVQVEAAGICGSDLHVYETGAYVTRVPVTMGHELSGTVLETGPDVRSLSPGDRVVGDSRVSCGACRYCRDGLHNLCPEIGFLGEVREGAFAEEILVDEPSLVKISPQVPFEAAVLAEPLAVALHALNQAKADPSARTLILGAGPVGALIHSAALLGGMADVRIWDLSPFRRETINRVHPASAIPPEGTYDLIFETTGASKSVSEKLPGFMARRGTLVMVGLFGAPVCFDFNQVVEKEWEVRGCAAFSHELPRAARLLEAHFPRLDHLVTHRFRLEDFQKAFDLVLSPEKNAMKVVFQPNRN